jgi:predicted DCC family thiol-disulfide oxidoreductase YuxK
VSAIVLFDGVCNLCTWAVQFILPRDRAGYFQFASLQSPIGKHLSEKYSAAAPIPDSVILIENDHMYTNSDAVLRIARHLDGFWSLAYALRFVPRGLRDWAYTWIAAHRYQIFGVRDVCLINVPYAQERFLEKLPVAAEPR